MSKSLLRYPGGKTFAVGKIMSYFPDDVTEMVSPFFGGGSVELASCERGIDVYGSDIFEPLVNFWQHVLNHKDELYKELLKFDMPLPKHKFYDIQKNFDDLPTDLVKAAAFYVLNRTSFSGTTFSGGMSTSQKNWNLKSVFRVRDFNLGGLFSSSGKLSVEKRDFAITMEEHKEKFAYMDPPYLLDVNNLYGNRGSTHKDFDHIEFFEAVKRMENKWVISYNDHPELVELYKDYNITRPTWRYCMKSKNGCKDSNEIVITNY